MSKKKAWSEHIEGDANRISFTHKGKSYTGWIEKRSEGRYDVAVVSGNFQVARDCTKKDVRQKVLAAAEKLMEAGGCDCEEA